MASQACAPRFLDQQKKHSLQLSKALCSTEVVLQPRVISARSLTHHSDDGLRCSRLSNSIRVKKNSSLNSASDVAAASAGSEMFMSDLCCLKD